MVRIFFVYFLCLLLPFLSYQHCRAQQSDPGIDEKNALSAYSESGYGQMEEGEVLIPEIDNPVELWTFIENYRFITGKMIHVTVQLIWKLGVSVNIDEFKNVDLSPFQIEEVTIGERQIFNNDCDFRVITYILSLPDDANEGIYTIPSFTISYKDEVDKTTGRTKTSPLTLKKVPIMVETKLDKDVVAVGDRISYELDIWHERYVKILKENMEKLDFNPFQAIDFNFREEIEGKLKKVTLKYGLSIYDLPDKDKNFEIPSLPVLYYVENEAGLGHKDGEEMFVTQETNTPAIPVLVNSLLKRIDVPLESIKGPVAYSKKDICMRGYSPVIFGIIIIIVLGVNEIRKHAGKVIKNVREKITESSLVHAEKLENLITDFNYSVEAKELRNLVINVDCALRVFLGTLVEISGEETLSFTTSGIIDALKNKDLANIIVESANNVLKTFDNVIFGDVNEDKIEKAINELQELLKETKRRGYY